jgi:hypothetical protein
VAKLGLERARRTGQGGRRSTESARALGTGEQTIPAAGEQPGRELIKDIERRMALLTVLLIARETRSLSHRRAAW